MILRDKESKEGIKRIFDLFIDDPNADTITLRPEKKNLTSILPKNFQFFGILQLRKFFQKLAVYRGDYFRENFCLQLFNANL